MVRVEQRETRHNQLCENEEAQGAGGHPGSDNGSGIGPRYFKEIFKIFQRIPSQEKTYSGTGIGLAVCEKIVERHGGRIRVESEPGKGTTFYWNMFTRNE